MIPELREKISTVIGHYKASRLPTLAVSVAQLRNLPNLDLPVGRLTLKQWNEYIIKFFHFAMERSIDIRIYAPNLAILLISKPQRGHMEAFTLARQFCPQFERLAAEQSQDPQMEHWADVFLTLKMLSLHIIANDADPVKMRERIRFYNEDMAKTAVEHKLPYKVQVR